jgi:hypothetical protein
MPFFFSNPTGFWALLGIPVILLIHFLQRQSQTLPASTLFLLDAIDRRSLRGRKIDKLRNSLPLWLQLLSVLVLTWLLVAPRWNSASSVQRIVIVLDSSASMEAFREESLNAIREEIPKLTRRTGGAAYTVLESHLRGKKLYRGESFSKLIDSLNRWAPSNSAHSPEGALRVGRSLAGTTGALIYVTDHLDESLPYGATLLSLGEPIENVGFAGLSVRSPKEGDDTIWQVTVRNYSDTPQKREWFLAVGQERTSGRSVTLEPRATRTLSGVFPATAQRVQLVLEADRFTLDDRLYIVRPEPKRITLAHNVAPNANELITAIIGSLENAPLFSTEGNRDDENARPDLVLSTYNPLDPRPAPPVSIVLLNQQNVPRTFFKGPIVAANHALIESLNWQGLIAKSTASIPIGERDVPLLWQGDRPLILLRQSGEIQQLIFNFDVIQSNAARLPSFVVLVHRFVDSVRTDKIAARNENAELGQPVDLAFDTGENAAPLVLTDDSGESTFPLNRAALAQAPSQPGFFTVRQGNKPLLLASANFADTREADFSEAASRSDLSGLPKEIVEHQTVTDPLWKIWAIALLLVALLTWHFLKQADHSSPVSEPT